MIFNITGFYYLSNLHNYINLYSRSHAFEILGYDILIDNNLKPWLLEINHTPSLEPLTELENVIKRKMISDLFELVDITAQRKFSIHSETERVWNILQE